MKKSLFLAIAVAILVSEVFILTSCNNSKLPKGFKGEWNGQLTKYESIELKIKDKDKFVLNDRVSNGRYDIQYKGVAVKVSDDVIKLTADQYYYFYNPKNRRPSDPTTKFGGCLTCFFLRSDGAFSKTENGLDNPMTYLSK